MIQLQTIQAGAFTWHASDATPLLPHSWADDIIRFARAEAVDRTLVPTSVTSREATSDLLIPVSTVGGRALHRGLPWLYDLYRGTFRDLVQAVSSEPVSIASDERYAINLNVQRGVGVRYEAHVDSNPWEGLLYATTHTAGEGGELIVSNRRDAAVRGVEAIEADCARIYPTAGTLVFFDAREFPHFVAPLADPHAVRVAVAMNFYTPSCPESARPADLNWHLFGQD
jgi:hypothetical protein